MDELTQALRTIVAEVGEIDDLSRVTESADLFADLGVNSILALEVLMLIEERLHITLPETALSEVKSFGDVVRVVGEHRTKG